MNIARQIAEELKIKVWQVEAVMELIDEGCTIPFIARYRKEKHGSLNDEQLRNLDERLTYLRNLEERKETVLASIEEQGKLTEELKQQILAAQTQVLLEDLYRPYRPKRRTRATIAKEKGLEGLANQILLQMLDHSVEEEAKQYLDEEKEVTTVEQAISGALDILAEAIADEADYRTAIRKTTMQKGSLVSTAKNAEEKSVERKPAQKLYQSSKKKPKKRESVIKRLREKQIAIAVKSGKPVPRYLEQEMERRRD